MNRFAEDLINALREALEHAKGAGNCIEHRIGNATTHQMLRLSSQRIRMKCVQVNPSHSKGLLELFSFGHSKRGACLQETLHFLG